jgi:hypothetical protein
VPRLHLFELEDQRWLPSSIRHGVTAYLNFVGNLSAAPYEDFAFLLAQAMRATGDRVLLDLCSGASGPVPTLLHLLKQRGIDARAILTDLYPDERIRTLIDKRSDGSLTYLREPVDATRVLPELDGFRILCNGFHHFPPSRARHILADTVQSGRGIALFEAVERRLPAMLACLAALIAVPLATLFMRPWRWDRAVLTFLIPIIPLAVAWDGLVSCVRVYSPSELRALVNGIPGSDGYRWHIQRHAVPRSPFGVTCLVGYPRQPATARPPVPSERSQSNHAEPRAAASL